MIYIAAFLMGVLAVIFLLVGTIFSVITAMGNKRFVWGWSSVLLAPIALVYCLVHWREAAYPGRFLLLGYISLGLVFVLGALFPQ